MLQIDKTIISSDILEKKFVCDIKTCKGECCVEGDSGAPLEKHELKILEHIYPIVKKYLTKKGIKAIEQQGVYITDNDGDIVTPLIDNKECAYTYRKKGIVKCAIEKAYFKGEINFRKPISCHLYPIRITKYKDFDAVNFDINELCKSSCILGKKENISLIEFLKEPLIRKYGKQWWEQLRDAAEIYNKSDMLGRK